jgi:hypothetical protein
MGRFAYKETKAKGTIVANNGYFRAQVKLMGRTMGGPARHSRSSAGRDLEEAQNAGSEANMKRVLEEKKAEKAGSEGIQTGGEDENGPHAHSECSHIRTPPDHSNTVTVSMDGLAEPSVPIRVKCTHTGIQQSHGEVVMSRRGLNIQWPFSQLILRGLKTEEIREYELDYRSIAGKDEEVWLVETKGPSPKASKNAIVDDVDIGPRPQDAQIVATITFTSCHRYTSEQQFRDARDRHRVADGSQFEWKPGVIYGWQVGTVRALAKPEPALSTNRSGFGIRWYPVVFKKANAQLDIEYASSETKGGDNKSGEFANQSGRHIAVGLIEGEMSRSSDSSSQRKDSYEGRRAILDLPIPCRRRTDRS